MILNDVICDRKQSDAMSFVRRLQERSSADVRFQSTGQTEIIDSHAAFRRALNTYFNAAFNL